MDLSGWTYDRITVHWQSLLRLPNGRRRVEPYDRQPYVQLEKVFRQVGKDREADEVYLERMRVERKLRYEKREIGGLLRNWLYRLTLSYGVRPWQLVWVPLLLLALGTVFFLRPGAVELKPESVSAGTAFERHSQAKAGQDSGTPQQFYWGDAARLTIRLFLPMDTPLAAHWQPTDQHLFRRIRYSDYAGILKSAGWVIVPLWVGFFSGLLRRRTT